MTSYIAGDNMITSLGFSTGENLQRMKKGETGVQLHHPDERLNLECCISLVDDERLKQIFDDFANANEHTRLEKLALTSLRYAVQLTDIDLGSPRTLIIFSTTKGNIDLLRSPSSTFPAERLQLWSAANTINTFFDNPNKPLVVSNACISGVLALLIGHRLLEKGYYRNIAVVGVDIASEFVVSGFQSFKALSASPCRPYDQNRNGLNLGEGAGTVLLTCDPDLTPDTKIVLRGGASANDANHISGPSREGDGLLLAIEKTLAVTGHPSEQVDYISAHGTATLYNDDMESKALNRAQLASVPVNSMKGFFGHTLGAAGVLESAASIASMRENVLVGTRGFTTAGTVEPLEVIRKTRSASIDHTLKLASGFGGCNAAILLSKYGSF